MNITYAFVAVALILGIAIFGFLALATMKG